MKRFGVDPYTRRLLRNWLRGRKFRLKYRLPSGTHLGEPTEIAAGLPQGSVPSPMLWLMFLNDIQEHLDQLRTNQGIPTSVHLDLVFADDMTTIIVEPQLDVLRYYAVENAQNMWKVMAMRHLSLQDPKTFNMLLRAQTLPFGIYRRGPPLSS